MIDNLLDYRLLHAEERTWYCWCCTFRCHVTVIWIAYRVHVVVVVFVCVWIIMLQDKTDCHSTALWWLIDVAVQSYTASRCRVVSSVLRLLNFHGNVGVSLESFTCVCKFCLASQHFAAIGWVLLSDRPLWRLQHSRRVG